MLFYTNGGGEASSMLRETCMLFFYGNKHPAGSDLFWIYLYNLHNLENAKHDYNGLI